MFRRTVVHVSHFSAHNYKVYKFAKWYINRNVLQVSTSKYSRIGREINSKGEFNEKNKQFVYCPMPPHGDIGGV